MFNNVSVEINNTIYGNEQLQNKRTDIACL